MTESLNHAGVKGMKWGIRNIKRVVGVAKKSVESQLKMHKSIILRDLEQALKSHEETTKNPITKKLAGLMKKKVRDLRAPSNKVLRWVQKTLDAMDAKTK